MSEIKKNIAIGLVFSAGIMLVLWVLLFLYPKFGDSGLKFHVRFADMEKVSTGSRITFAGRPVGHVVKISAIARECPKGIPNSPIYCYDALLAIDSHVTVYDTDEIMLSTSGLMGERYVAITPKPAANPRPLVQDEVVYATELPSVTDSVQSVSQNLQELFISAKTSSQNFDKLCANLNRLLTQVNSGQGSLGKFVINDDFYYKTSALMSKVDLLLTDFNNYGVMYQWSNTWKQEQKARELTLAKLKNPEEFNQFLTDRIVQITSALNSLKMAAQAAEGIELQKDKDGVARVFAAVLQELCTIQSDIHTFDSAKSEEVVAIQD